MRRASSVTPAEPRSNLAFGRDESTQIRWREIRVWRSGFRGVRRRLTRRHLPLVTYLSPQRHLRIRACEFGVQAPCFEGVDELRVAVVGEDLARADAVDQLE